MRPVWIGPEDIDGRLGWRAMVDAIEDGTGGPRPSLRDMLAPAGAGEALCRLAAVDGLGIAVKAVTIFPDASARAPPAPTVKGAVLVFDDRTGALDAIVDGALVTRWKTAADSLAGARRLAAPGPRRLLVLGAGAVAASFIEAYPALFPTLEDIVLWARDPAKAEALAATGDIRVAANLPQAIGEADIIVGATAATEPLIEGARVRPGAHVDLVGAHGPSMREADDVLMRRARIFVDCRETTLGAVGEIDIPIAAGAIGPESILGDLYDLAAGAPGRTSPEDVTVFKNGGGAHFDLMIARAIMIAAGAVTG